MRYEIISVLKQTNTMLALCNYIKIYKYFSWQKIIIIIMIIIIIIIIIMCSHQKSSNQACIQNKNSSIQWNNITITI